MKLYDVLIVKNNMKYLEENKDYFLITKEQWYFLFDIYGGGPTIYKTIEG